MTPGPKKGPPQKRFSAFAGRGGARERVEFSPQAETEQSGLCDDEVEEARAGLYHQQAEELREARAERQEDGSSVPAARGCPRQEEPSPQSSRRGEER